MKKKENKDKSVDRDNLRSFVSLALSPGQHVALGIHSLIDKADVFSWEFPCRRSWCSLLLAGAVRSCSLCSGMPTGSRPSDVLVVLMKKWGSEMQQVIFHSGWKMALGVHVSIGGR